MDPISRPIVTAPEPVSRQKNNKPLLVFIILVLLGVSAFVAFKIRESKSASSAPPTPTPTVVNELPTDTPTPEESPTPEVTDTPTATPKPPVKAATDMNLQVLNGSGEVGVAGTAKDYLSGKGYKYFETGNADNFDYQGVTVRIKPSMQKYLTQLQSDLSGKYTLASNSGTLTDDALFDAVIVVGK